MKRVLVTTVSILALAVLPPRRAICRRRLGGARLSPGNTAWVIMATALVMFMTVPALGLFYGGLVRKKNVLSVLMQCFITLALVSVLWVAFGYSLAFSDGELIPGVLGDFKWAFLSRHHAGQLSPLFRLGSRRAGYPTSLRHVPVHVRGHHAGPHHRRLRRADEVLLLPRLYLAWQILIYCPLAHMVWSSGGWLYKLGVLDFAGGTVVHINAGFAALVDGPRS